MPFKKKPTNPDRVGLSLHKHLVPHVLEKSKALDMNPNEFVNGCVEDCVSGMLAAKDPGPGSPSIVNNYRLRVGTDPQPIAQRLNATEYALLRSLDEVLYDLNLAKDGILDGKSTSTILSSAILELIQQYRAKRSDLIAQAQLIGKEPVYRAPQIGI
jgi:hypothetical protein